MDTIDLSNWPAFKSQANQLREDLLTLVGEADKVVGNTSMSNEAKTLQVSLLLAKYLPS